MIQLNKIKDIKSYCCNIYQVICSQLLSQYYESSLWCKGVRCHHLNFFISFSDFKNGSSVDWQVSASHSTVPHDTSDQPYQQESKDTEVKVVVLGAPGVGKTAIVQVRDSGEKIEKQQYFLGRHFRCRPLDPTLDIWSN